jgi:hypothetical protein
MGVIFRSHEGEDEVVPNLSHKSFFNNHPELRNALLNYYCIRLTQRANRCDVGLLCQDCYYSLDPEDQELYEESENHYLCRRAGYLRATYCGLCDIRIAHLQNPMTCYECIEDYVNTISN